MNLVPLNDGLLGRPGTEYWHRTWGRIMYVGGYPPDGSTLVIERQETTDLDDDDHVLDTCERSDLFLLEVQDQWPYLGFTSKERSAEQSRAFGASGGFAEVPEGSGRWFYPDGRRVPDDEWSAAWQKFYGEKS